MIYRWILRPLLYSLPAETAHHLIIGLMSLVARVPPLISVMRMLYGVRDPSLRVQAFGLELPSPITLAAGLDKDAQAIEAFGALGFGAVEVGTITGEPQPGNPRPRLFRLPPDRALINRMGFNNRGAADAAARLSARGAHTTALGVNIGKTKVVPSEQAQADYERSTRLLAPHADYLVVNVSSPNTPGLRDLQAVELLRPLLSHVQHVLAEVRPDLPLLVKIAPDLAEQDVDAVADLAVELDLAGIIATNTTIGREGLTTGQEQVEAMGGGGLSGAPLRQRALEVLQRLRRRCGDRVMLISVGGVETGEEAYARIRAGATLVQIYTAMIYEGPTLPSRMARTIATLLQADGLSSVHQAVGLDAEPRAPR